ncbi:MAG: T9SS type A sorting domain-containing protein [Bacteroidales bacterium]|nr:T9SS type A sorting domain-containing protein [Bacteroidales bacterium]
MKNFTNFLIFVIMLVLCPVGINAQEVVDPIMNVYRIGGSSELYIAYSNANKTFNCHGIMDVPEGLDDVTTKEGSVQSKNMGLRRNAAATGDFNGDGVDEVVCIRDNSSGGIKITIPLINDSLKIDSQKEYYDEALNISAYERLRICVGNFDCDPQDEFAIAYGKPGETITISLYETDSALNIRLIDSFKEIVYYDWNFDINAGDTDGDGIDEIVMVKNCALPWETNSAVNPPIFNSKYDLYILAYNLISKELEIKKEKKNMVVANPVPNEDYWYKGILINEMRIACGDLNADGKDELVVGWSSYYCYYRIEICDVWFFGCIKSHWEFYYCDAQFLNTFGYSASGEIEHRETHFVGSSNYGQRSVPASQHIALSLKCEQLDNMGPDEVLVTSSSRFCVYQSTGVGMNISKKVNYASGCLNIKGNENFLVADLNPDTLNLNFNKEVILLKSDKTYLEQINGVSSAAYMEILALDTIGPDVIAFQPPGPAHDIPFSDVSNIEISAFVAGDFDLKEAHVFYVGTPEVIPVSDMQQPIVVLNAPPVHFDVFEGRKFDLCNAFTGNENPPFYARYNTVLNEKRTTSVGVNDACGFSKDLSGYAMIGGTGFEKSASEKWDSGKSYYQAYCQNKIIEEEKTVYTEDYVLYSAMDYTYYRYPVYNQLRSLIGYMAVLNPKSAFSSNWDSGNSWEHPSYIFNHETGNILSYKPYKNTADFFSGPTDFSSYQYSRVPVAHTGDGSFKFVFANITDTDTTYSFSSGAGSDFFGKVGVEATVSVETAPFGVGVSISSDMRIGISREVSDYYSNSTLNTHKTTLSNTFKIDGIIGRLDIGYNNSARYFIRPYIYRSQSGAIVLDYMVELDEANDDWWLEKYGNNPDLAFILPWRYATEKGSTDTKISKKQKTSDIQFYKPIVKPGDTVCIIARVHNYSLADFNNKLEIEFFLGDPLEGGIKLTDIFGQGSCSKNVSMVYGAEDVDFDNEEYLAFNWKVPDTITCSPRIYAVIDPDNLYTEIHKNNNTGWNKLYIIGCKECQYPERVSFTESPQANTIQIEAYPNPFSGYTNIRFYLPVAERVKIELFTLSGVKVADIANDIYPAGQQEIRFEAGNLRQGAYFYKVSAGNKANTAKLFVL